MIDLGVFGHSMGAMGALVAAGGGIGNRTNPSDFNIKAAVSMHPCWDPVEKSANVKVCSIMFATVVQISTCIDCTM